MFFVNEMNILNQIKKAFTRPKPTLLSVSEQLSIHELNDVLSFLENDWLHITCDQLEQHFEFIYWLNPDAFCYYLPGIFYATVLEKRSDIIVIHSIIEMLDRSPNPDFWDSFFIQRWTKLSIEELEAAQAWVLWLTSMTTSISDDSLSRAFDTLALLQKR